jgi:hypothetical protein
MDHLETPVVDSELEDGASGYCRYCGHLIAPLDPPVVEQED